jgi:methionine sulfoxide reductase heme-binding subunit
VHLTSSPLDWYAARAGGVVAYLLLSAVVALGLTMSGKKTLKRWPRFALEDIHRYGGLLVGTFIAIHVATIAIDSYLPFSPAALAIPLVSRYRPLWVALGIVAAELLLALAVTNHYRDSRLSYGVWRRAHYLNFAVWSAATVHGLGSGTDRSAVWLLALYALAVATVSALIAWRVARTRRLTPVLQRLAPVVAAGAAVFAIVALALGPLRFHPKRWNAASFRDTLTGRILRDSGVTRGIVSMAGNGDGPQRVLVRADLLIAPGRLLSTVFAMEYLPSGLLCRGAVTHVHDYGFEATCRLPRGGRRFVHAQWQPAEGSDLQGGIITAHA